MANRSRVKTDEEYSSIIGSKVEDKDLKVTHDASRYFDELRDFHVQEEEENPFEKKVSMEDLKTSIKQRSDFVDVDQIKEEIAKIQVETTPEETNIPLEKSEDRQVKRFSFEENARKLYENLRESKVTPYYEKESASEQTKEASKDTIEVVEPVTIDKEQVDALENSPKPQPVKEDLFVEEIEIAKEEAIPFVEPAKASVAKPIIEETQPIDLSHFDKDIVGEHEAEIEELDFSELELTADFTKENENFLEAVGFEKEVKAQLPQEPLFTPAAKLEDESVEPTEEIAVEDVAEDIEDSSELNEFLTSDEAQVADEDLQTFYGNDDLLNILKTQEDQVDYNTMVNEKDLISQINEISENASLEDELEELTKKPKSTSLSDTLTMALDNEKSISFSPTEIKELKEEDFKADDEVPKRKVSDIIITILLIVMIIVVAYLLYRMVTNT